MDAANIAIGAGIALGFGALGIGIGEGIAVYGGLTGMSRQPEAHGRLLVAMLIGLAFIELIFFLIWITALGLTAKVPTLTPQQASQSGARAS